MTSVMRVRAVRHGPRACGCCHNVGVRDGVSERGTGLTGFRRYTWWAVPGTAVLCLLPLYGGWLLDGDVPAWAPVPAVAALAVAAVAGAVLLSARLAPQDPDGAGPVRPPRGWLFADLAATAVLAVMPLLRQNYGLWGLAPAIAVAIGATYLTGRRRLAFVGGAVALATLPGGSVALAAGDGEFLYAALFPAGLVAFSVWMLLGPLWAWDVAGRLDRARRLEAEVAVKDERLRFAADLHDIQGHHLQVIALKSELAARLAERDPARAAAEMRDVRQLAADALHDTRAVVHGYRSTTLDDEIANATRVLAAADIDARMTLDPAAVAAGRAAPARHLLGLVVREATTNVLRHSSARRAEVDYRLAGGLARLRFSNDGASEPSAASRPSGSGLPGLAERLRAAGGELTWARDGDRFEVVASLPGRANGAAR
ncbi:histidine kinase [Streptomyces sp. NBC_01808]|nr:histidine kinase [Streptomyces sp. NBC_01808]WSA42139.1 histidine kinase [Streptomyces sp. NBC_01808]